MTEKYQAIKANEIIQTLIFNANVTASAQLFTATSLTVTPALKYIVSNGGSVPVYFVQGNTTAIAATTTTGTIVPANYVREFKPNGLAVSLVTATSNGPVSVDAAI